MDIERDYCLICRQEIPTESGIICSECAEAENAMSESDDRPTGGIKAIRESQDMLDPKSWASLTALGPILAGIAWAFGVYLGAPTGYALLAGAGVFSLFVVLAHSGTASKVNLLALFLAGTMILFWQGALCSTAGGAVAAEADSQAPAVSLGDLFVPDAMAGGQAAVLFTVEKHGGQYEVRRDGSLWEVPVDVYQAIAQYERRQRKGFGVRF